jgi:hypothetical protein
VARVLVVLAEEEEDEVGVELLAVLLGLVDREDEAAALGILGVLPLGLDAALEVLDGVDAAPLVLDEVAGWGAEYLRWRPSGATRKLSRLLRPKWVQQ